MSAQPRTFSPRSPTLVSTIGCSLLLWRKHRCGPRVWQAGRMQATALDWVPRGSWEGSLLVTDLSLTVNSLSEEPGSRIPQLPIAGVPPSPTCRPQRAFCERGMGRAGKYTQQPQEPLQFLGGLGTVVAPQAPGVPTKHRPHFLSPCWVRAPV